MLLIFSSPTVFLISVHSSSDLESIQIIPGLTGFPSLSIGNITPTNPDKDTPAIFSP